MKKLIYTLLIIIALTNNSFSAGDSNTTAKASDYTKAKNLINAAKKYEKKVLRFLNYFQIMVLEHISK